MRPHYLTPFFAPQSVVIVGPLSSSDALSRSVYDNLTLNHYQGELYAINTLSPSKINASFYPNLNSLPITPDLLMLDVAVDEVQSYLEQCGELNINHVVLMTNVTQLEQTQAEKLKTIWRAITKAQGIRVMGPNCAGVMRPLIGMSTSLMKPGTLGMVSQSTALTSGVLDWASGNGLGFSAVVSLNDSIDIGFAEIVDYLVSDHHTQSILIFVEEVVQARQLMSALREAARVKPTIVLKADKHALLRTGDQLSDVDFEQTDGIFNAALRRVGVVRVRTMTQLFAAARACSLRYRKSGPHLAIISNGEGPAALATDRALDNYIPMAQLSETTLNALNGLIKNKSGNPIDLGATAKAQNYKRVAQLLLNAPEVDSLLVILCPQHGSESDLTAYEIAELAKQSNKPIMACWMGDQSVVPARRLFSAHRVPNFRTPESAVDAIRYINQYLHNQRMLFQTTSSRVIDALPDLDRARHIIHEQVEQGSLTLTPLSTEKLLAAFDLTYRANMPMPPNTSKQSRIMIDLGVVRDSTLGPSLYITPGGMAAHLPHSKTYALPPLNQFLAVELIERSVLSHLNHPSSEKAISQHQALIYLILRLSEMCCELAAIETIELNLWLKDDDYVEILYAHITLNKEPVTSFDYRHLAIHPYPLDLVKSLTLKSNLPIHIRPIRPEDAEMEQEFVKNLSEDSRYFRFLDALKELPRSLLVRFTQLDYATEMALIATTTIDNQEKQLGVARYTTNPDGESCEFALVIADQYQGQGLGTTLMNELILCAQSRGLYFMTGEVLGNNTGMLHLMHTLGFTSTIAPDEPSLRVVTLDLRSYEAKS
ncbi:GNAT family N-acetyltransferase [Ferrovum sp. PN-J185]|uniref:bifunctional acetate--CoA ligase family protein/GNAT family N-acetyltransferase n=1 Tax=Ferrovum sp. PN-J185 TaxID=1356306 RepID=UPI0007984EF8|nr:GNAT family N-acetyltransferase [Ferrovum sp. PN-J185]KXW56697.1 acetyltransferase Pat [Ferrovum sp. PN-J185]MCC6067617.1 GNAT family N-acetyltransferase [Ferrovum sp. PN-J185]